MMRKFVMLACFLAVSGGLLAKSAPAEYMFYQELSNRPRLAPLVVGPMINLALVDEFAKKKYDLKAPRWQDRREWLASEYPILEAWYKGWETLNAKPKTYKALDTFLRKAINGESGAPIMPYVFDKKQRSVAPVHEAKILIHPPFMSIPWRLKRKGERESVPFNFLDYSVIIRKRYVPFETKLKNTQFLGKLMNLELDFHGLTIPFVRDARDKQYRIYYREDDIIKVEVLDEEIKKMLDKMWIQTGKWRKVGDFSKDLKSIHDRFKKKLKKRLGLTDWQVENVVLWKPRTHLRGTLIRKLGVDRVGGLPFKGGYKPGVRTFIPMRYGLYKLMFLALGIDSNKDLVTKDNPKELAVAKDLQQLIEDTTNHPWKSTRFNKENFLNYEIAKLLQGDSDLLMKVKKTIDFSLRPWREFKDFRYNKKYNRYTGDPFLDREVERFMPGDEQALAAMIIEAVHLLWVYASWRRRVPLTKKLLLPATLVVDPTKAGMELWGVGWMRWLQIFAKRAYEKKRIYKWMRSFWRFFSHRYWLAEKYSFVDVWGEIVNRLRANWGRQGITRQNWIAFNGTTGFVMSFDPSIVDLQRGQYKVDTKILDDIKVTCVDSWYGPELGLFYKKLIRE